MLGKGGRQRKWCAPAAMEPIVGASRTSDSEHMLKKEHDNYVFSLVKAVTHAHCNVRTRGTTWRKHYTHDRKILP